MEDSVKEIDEKLKHAGLTLREMQILRYLALGKSDREISVELLISVKTVNHHVGSIMQKLVARNRTHAVAKALLARLIEMRASDAPLGMFGRRRDDKGRAIQIQPIGNGLLAGVGIQLQTHAEEATPWPPSDRPIALKPEI